MILALRTIRKTIPDVLYAIIGDGEEAPYLRELVAREGLSDHVQFLGEISDRHIVECYQQCDLFALPNRAVGDDGLSRHGDRNRAMPDARGREGRRR